ncbi:Na+/H+ antiporter subunit E [Pseudohalocynthiibacter aestuariivivens]|uniref:Na+/H+ antiporter subunit E n=1 Tax=Pseudohalocynthiibacter aestuariivivens TaxID=1591409 RepID=A0ABV5JJX1_9RHOB|nr:MULTISPECIES: Na+/H+ antiporter subunit E [Pseudohalocynthiibacter]MCK0104045.1 Na+/H+ antiporter subunit E [Pseudohalocynthiibacter sp. F2068]
MRFLGSFVVLLGLWLLLSGIYQPLIVGFGVVSVLIVIFVVKRMDALDEDRVALRLSPVEVLKYMLWLFVEIAKANWAVTKTIMSPQMPLRQHLFSVQNTQKSDLAQVIYASSITLTPGTITVETEPGHFLVHAVAYTDEDIDALADMDRRVSAIEMSEAQ